MRLEIPENAQVHIVIGRGRPLALPDETGGARRQSTIVRPIVRGAVVAALLCGAFVMGKQFGAVRTIAPAVAAAQPQPDDRQTMPPAFTHQLQQPPVVTPPPARPAPGKSPFGLDR
jgi:hypothetical protein